MADVLAEAETGHDAQHDVGQVGDQERKARHCAVYVLRVKIRVVNGQVSFHGHGAEDGHPGRAEEEHREGEEVAEQRSSGPAVGHVRGDHHRAGEARPQQVRDGHAADQSVERGFLLLLFGDAQHDNGDQVP